MSTAQRNAPAASTVASALTAAVQSAARGNSHTAAPAAAVLWPDKERQWKTVLPTLKRLVPELLELGSYDPDSRSGPAIWLKCAIAGVLPDAQFQGVPVVYLPGVSRSELRAIESCSRELQPLAELQYRGTIWSQVNARDWTVNAFLTSRHGGLGLDVAQDRATQDALLQALETGVLLEQPIDALKGRQITSDWLHGLLAPNPNRNLLLWLNDPQAMQAAWAGVQWEVFAKLCLKDFGFNPATDGPLTAAEKLAKRQGKWSAVYDLYRDSFASYPNIYDQLLKVQAPDLGFFYEAHQVLGYPQVNEQREVYLRGELSACVAKTTEEARTAILAAEGEHGVRREWVWARMGRAPLAEAIGHLATVAQFSSALPIGSDPDQLAESYRSAGWKVDDAALQAIAAVSSKSDLDAVNSALRSVYAPWLDECARRLQESVKQAGGLSTESPGFSKPKVQEGTCTIFVDGLRYDVAKRVVNLLSDLGAVQLDSRWTSLPSVTASGKAWCSPVAGAVVGSVADTDFEPRVASDGKELSAHNFRKLLNDAGIQYLTKHEAGDPKGLAWTECGDLDHFGHEHGTRLAKNLPSLIREIVERIDELIQAGWRRFSIVTDHGWLLMPGGLPKAAMSKFETETRWGRCAVLKGSANSDSLTFGWDWCKDVQVAYAPGSACFVSGTEYAHGGISFQECLVPVISLTVSAPLIEHSVVAINSVVWKGLRCVVQVESNTSSELLADIRLKPAVADTSLLNQPKALKDGQVSLAVADDQHAGSAAVVVIIGPGGEVLQKMATTVGG